MQNKEITERDYWLQRSRGSAGELVGEDWADMMSFVQRARGAHVETVIRPEACDAIERAAAAGVRLAILSNELDLFYGADFRQLPARPVRGHRRCDLYEDPEALTRAPMSRCSPSSACREKTACSSTTSRRTSTARPLWACRMCFSTSRGQHRVMPALKMLGLETVGA